MRSDSYAAKRGWFLFADLVALVLLRGNLPVDHFLEILKLRLHIFHVIDCAVVEKHDEAERRYEKQADPEKFSNKSHRGDIMQASETVNPE